MNLVTGYRGYAHVTSNDQAALHRAVFGGGHCVFNTGSVFSATFADTGVIRIADGEAMIQGHHMRIAPGEHEDVTLTAGESGLNRADYIAIRYTKDAGGVESAAIVQICGTATSGTASPPTLTQQDTSRFDSVYEVALYRINFSGLVIGNPTAVFTAVANLQAQIDAVKQASETGLVSARQEAQTNLNTATQTLQTNLNTAMQTLQTNLNTVTQDLQNQINGKQATITGAASLVAASDLTANRALVSNGSGKIAVSNATSTDLDRIAGLTSNAQAQLNSIIGVLNGIGTFKLTGADANVASCWSWVLRQFDNAATISQGFGNLTSKVQSGYWIPPGNGWFIMRASVTFASNKTGARSVRIALFDASNKFLRQSGTMSTTPIAHAVSISVTGCGMIYSGQKIALQVMQDSGTTLAVGCEANILWIPDL